VENVKEKKAYFMLRALAFLAIVACLFTGLLYVGLRHYADVGTWLSSDDREAFSYDGAPYKLVAPLEELEMSDDKDDGDFEVGELLGEILPAEGRDRFDTTPSCLLYTLEDEDELVVVRYDDGTRMVYKVVAEQEGSETEPDSDKDTTA
jgi:hypothetical protein